MAWDYSVRGSGPVHTARVETPPRAVGLTRSPRVGLPPFVAEEASPQVETVCAFFQGAPTCAFECSAGGPPRKVDGVQAAAGDSFRGNWG